MDIEQMLIMAVERGASDLHLTVGFPPALRLDGKLVPTTLPVIKPVDTEKIAQKIIPPGLVGIFKEFGECDFSYSLHGLGRFRVNVFRQRGMAALAMRVIQSQIPELDELCLPPTVETFTRKNEGLVLVTGPTGSGKSTTLAALINLINERTHAHILTLEDPIEYLHKHKKSIINQREIGQDSSSFSRALRVCLRQDPDVILVGEMRDLETIETAITAAETGHLVFATLHTVDAPKTIDRIIDVFPPRQQQQVRVQLAGILEGIIAQRLIPRKEKGRIAAVEILTVTPAVRNLIREGKIYQIYSVMQTGTKYGMQTLDSHLKYLYSRGIITREDALSNAVDFDNLKRLMEN
ncbi:MAG: type IV pili twitching motility protein PilT [Firmicutes bacterium HGW-Firmicutes-13]|nr:MAG: type IV pili twitching motility protein PilT [Firmicutes bacterium HGW-Firmicutes-13]